MMLDKMDGSIDGWICLFYENIFLLMPHATRWKAFTLQQTASQALCVIMGENEC